MGFTWMLVVAYAATAAAALVAPWAPRVFWTVLMPAVPLAVVALGLRRWRALCPIARIGGLGARAWSGRRAPAGLSSFTLPLGLLILLLAFRLLAANGDGFALGALLLALLAGAAFVDARWGGRAWCNHLCPIGVVERIYTDGLPGDGRATPCTPCSGCTRSCPDIDPGRAHVSSLASRDRALAAFAFPGLVISFYGYYWLRGGSWEAFFDGAWTERALDRELVLGAGFFFAPRIPAMVAAPLTLLCGAALSACVLFTVERALVSRGHQPRPLRHRLLALSSFVAFNLFYLFAGAPTLRLCPPVAAAVAFVVHVVSTAALFRRWPEPSRLRLIA
jgi:hypothetical protein